MATIYLIFVQWYKAILIEQWKEKNLKKEEKKI